MSKLPFCMWENWDSDYLGELPKIISSRFRSHSLSCHLTLFLFLLVLQRVFWWFFFFFQSTPLQLKNIPYELTFIVSELEFWVWKARTLNQTYMVLTNHSIILDIRITSPFIYISTVFKWLLCVFPIKYPFCTATGKFFKLKTSAKNM